MQRRKGQKGKDKEKIHFYLVELTERKSDGDRVGDKKEDLTEMVTDVQHRQQQAFQQDIEVLRLSDRSFSDPVSCHNWRLAGELAEGKKCSDKAQLSS